MKSLFGSMIAIRVFLHLALLVCIVSPSALADALLFSGHELEEICLREKTDDKAPFEVTFQNDRCFISKSSGFSITGSLNLSISMEAPEIHLENFESSKIVSIKSAKVFLDGTVRSKDTVYIESPFVVISESAKVNFEKDVHIKSPVSQEQESSDKKTLSKFLAKKNSHLEISGSLYTAIDHFANRGTLKVKELHILSQSFWVSTEGSIDSERTIVTGDRLVDVWGSLKSKVLWINPFDAKGEVFFGNKSSVDAGLLAMNGTQLKAGGRITAESLGGIFAGAIELYAPSKFSVSSALNFKGGQIKISSLVTAAELDLSGDSVTFEERSDLSISGDARIDANQSIDLDGVFSSRHLALKGKSLTLHSKGSVTSDNLDAALADSILLEERFSDAPGLQVKNHLRLQSNKVNLASGFHTGSAQIESDGTVTFLEKANVDVESLGIVAHETAVSAQVHVNEFALDTETFSLAPSGKIIVKGDAHLQTRTSSRLDGELKAKRLWLLAADSSLETLPISRIEAETLVVNGTTTKLQGKILAHSLATLEGKESLNLTSESETHAPLQTLRGSHLFLDGKVEGATLGITAEEMRIDPSARFFLESSLAVNATKQSIAGRISSPLINCRSREGLVIENGASLTAVETLHLQGKEIHNHGHLSSGSTCLEFDNLYWHEQGRLFSEGQTTLLGKGRIFVDAGLIDSGNFAINGTDLIYGKSSDVQTANVTESHTERSNYGGSFKSFELRDHAKEIKFGSSNIEVAQTYFDNPQAGVEILDHASPTLGKQVFGGKKYSIEQNAGVRGDGLHIKHAEWVRINGHMAVADVDITSELLGISGKIEGKNARLEADKLVTHETAELLADTVAMIAKVEMDHSGTLKAKSSVYVKTPNGYIPVGSIQTDGWMTIDSNFTREQVLQLMNAQHKNFGFAGIHVVTDIPIEITEDLSGDHGKGLEAKSIKVGAVIKGTKAGVFLRSTEGDVDLDNAVLVGAKSKDGVSVHVDSKKDIKMKHSILHGGDDVVLSAEGAIHDEGKVIKHSRKECHDEGWLGQVWVEEEDFWSEVETSSLSSQSGGIHIRFGADSSFTGTQFASQDGLHFESDNKANLKFYDYVLQARHREHSSHLFGSGTSTSEHDEQTPAVLLDRKYIFFDTEGETFGRGVAIVSPTAIFKGKRTFLSAPTLHHKEEHEEEGFFVAGLPRTLQTLTDSETSLLERLKKTDAMLASVGRMSESENPEDAAVNLSSVFTNLYRDAKAFEKSANAGAFVGKKLGVTNQQGDFDPSIGLGYEEEKDSSEWTSKGTGFLRVENLVIENDEDAAFSNGFEVHVDKSSRIKTKKLSATGFRQDFESSHEKTSVTVDGAMSGVEGVNIDFAQEKEHSSGEHWQNAKIHLGEDAFIDTDVLELDAARVTMGTLRGRINELNIKSRVDKEQQRGHTLSFGVTVTPEGVIPNHVGGGYKRTDSETVAQQAGLHTRNNIENEDVKIKTVTLEGGSLTSDGQINLKIERVVAKNVEEKTKKDGKGASISLQEPGGDFSYDTQDYQATLHATIAGKGGTKLDIGSQEGDLNTDFEKKKVVQKDSKHKATGGWTIPEGQSAPSEKTHPEADQIEKEEFASPDVETNAQGSEETGRADDVRDKPEPQPSSDTVAHGDRQEESPGFQDPAPTEDGMSLGWDDVGEFCFPGETLVRTADGFQRIDKVNVGDFVIACDFEGRQCTERPVERVYVRESSDLVRLELESGYLEATSKHPFYELNSQSYKEASSLNVGDALLSLEGETVWILGIDVLSDYQRVYNIQVEGEANYYVSSRSLNGTSILVHNCGGVGKGAWESFKDVWVGLSEMLHHPVDTTVELYETLTNPDELVEQLKQELSQVIEEFPDYSPEEKGELVGKISAELSTLFLPGATLKGAKTLRSVMQESRLASKVEAALTRVGEAHKEILEAWKANPERGAIGHKHLGHHYHPAPKQLEAFPETFSIRPKNPVQNGGILRKRWKDKAGDLYEWDYQHGAVEKYNSRGKHLGEFDPQTGSQTKPRDPNKDLPKKYL